MSGSFFAWIAFGMVATTTGLWFRAMHGVRIPADRTPYLIAWIGGAAIGASALLQGASGLSFLLGLLALIAGVFFPFTISISRQRVDEPALAVGDDLPEFSAPDEHGGTFESAALAGHPVLIKFFRGHW